MTLDALAAEAGISASHLSRLERSQTLPSFTVLAKIAEVLGVGIDEFVRLERDVTLLDRELVHYLDLLAIAPPVREELFSLSIEARRSLVTRLRQLSEAELTPRATQESVARTIAERDLPDAWRSLSRSVRQAGMGGPAFMRAFVRVTETPGPRVFLAAERSFFLLPPEADIVAHYRAIFPDEPLDPAIVSWWETSEWLRDRALVRRWPVRAIVSRGLVANALERRQFGPLAGMPGEDIRRVLLGWRDRLERDPGFELAITDADLGPFNFLVVRNQVGLLERLPDRRGREGTPRIGFWLNGPEVVSGFTDLVDRIWDRLPAEDRERTTLLEWLDSLLQSRASER